MKFSIITICRNNLNELLQTYASIKAQRSGNYEWIIIDGNSSDGTKEWLNQTPGISKWKSEPDKGIYDAMNKGTQLANGDFLIFMNSGDEFYDGEVLIKIEEVLNSLKESPAFIFGDSVDVDEKGTEYYRKAKKSSSIKYGMITQHQAMFFNRRTLPETAYPERYKLSADYALIARTIISSPGNKLIQANFPVCKFKMGGTNESKRFRAMAEDFHIRRNVLKLSGLEASYLYFLHFNHALLKHYFKKSRFIRHKNIPG